MDTDIYPHKNLLKNEKNMETKKKELKKANFVLN